MTARAQQRLAVTIRMCPATFVSAPSAHDFEAEAAEQRAHGFRAKRRAQRLAQPTHDGPDQVQEQCWTVIEHRERAAERRAPSDRGQRGLDRRPREIHDYPFPNPSRGKLW